MFKPFTLNIRGRIVTVDRPMVMGILNVTPDSFYESSRNTNPAAIAGRVRLMMEQGADIIDIGGYSSRPGADVVSPEEEWERLETGLSVVRKISQDIMVSVDTFRADIAARCVKEYGVDIINDISGGDLDDGMWSTVAALKVPYVLMHMRGTPATMQSHCDYSDVTAEVIGDLSRKLRQLHLMGVADVIVDPGFGFSKTTEQNFRLFRDLELFGETLGAPVLVGISRKSMITRALGIGVEQSLAGTVALDTIALTRNASIIRVHDVEPAVQSVKLYMMAC